ncbi:MAG: hypothetical protein ACREVR_10120 [Burkholderiales bacterium]
MPKDTGRNDRRSRIAYLAARLMAEDGIEDYALAKRKAARQAGMPDSGELPTNEEVEEALRTHQEIYHPAEHRKRLRVLRETAVRAMRELARFNPHLTGSVLNGNAGKYADVNLQLFTDNEKAVELYLIDQRIPYKAEQGRLYSGEAVRTVPVYTLSDHGTDIELTVLSMLDLRGPLRTSPEGRSIERAKLQAVEQLLADV